MTRLTLIALTGVFLISGVAAALVGGAEAHSPASATPSIDAPTLAPIERCSLQPQRVSHPDNGASILVLRTHCQ
jgi:hypothetical protein